MDKTEYEYLGHFIGFGRIRSKRRSLDLEIKLPITCATSDYTEHWVFAFSRRLTVDTVGITEAS